MSMPLSVTRKMERVLSLELREFGKTTLSSSSRKERGPATTRLLNCVLIVAEVRPHLRIPVYVLIAVCVIYFNIMLLNMTHVISWYPIVELRRALTNRCGRPPTWKVDERIQIDPKVNFPIYMLHGRSSPVSSHILDPLEKSPFNYTIYLPKVCLDDLYDLPSWQCRVVSGHRDIIREAFVSHPASEHIIVVEDDAQLYDTDELMSSLRYYLHNKLPFYSLHDEFGDPCTKYRFSTVAYVMRRDFYHKKLLKTCLQEKCDKYDPPLDICLSANYALEKVQSPVFVHSDEKKSTRKETPKAFSSSAALRGGS